MDELKEIAMIREAQSSGEVFEHRVHSREETAAMFQNVLNGLEQQRLIAWLEVRTSPGDRKKVEALAELESRQKRAERAVDQWRAANPAPEEE